MCDALSGQEELFSERFGGPFSLSSTGTDGLHEQKHISFVYYATNGKKSSKIYVIEWKTFFFPPQVFLKFSQFGETGYALQKNSKTNKQKKRTQVFKASRDGQNKEQPA